ncbi:M48 family metallopeptidase [Aquimarina sp. MMG015]|uniref:M48 family metallopeptidase n=1 Tax=Aquimarina TaxID=290174 RepID=UPI000402921C|nr:MULTISPECIES: M48 family metallopeptidase [Aquimarina]AXT54726.1 M48 family peptidase [Aquimarina sp. AD1]MBQ4805604.1 M48 family metallopeptidase [Aquimarina sp. MMG015]RKN14471.1 M48 family peptidase [Aquimarina sp. AD1]
MTSNTLFQLLIAIIVIVFLIDSLLDILNARHYNNDIPDELSDVYPEDEYQKSIAYKKANYKFKLISSLVSLCIMLMFFYLDGFAWVDAIARSFSNNSIIVGLLFFGIIMISSDILSTPAAYYKTFIIEEQFGFNKTTIKTFFIDKIKGIIMMIIVGGGLLALILWFYEITGKYFWVYAWALISIFTLAMNMFYAKLIVPLFNKQTPLEPGELRDTIQEYSNNVGFQLRDIFVIDGSKRSTKANAYFSGLGSEKRITLYDTLIKDLNKEEIVAVLAHEVGHYKKRHVIMNLLLSILLTGVTLWFLSLFIANPLLSEALGVEIPSFHIGLVAFGILYSPISEITGLIMNVVSRAFEYQADDYAKSTYDGEALINSLKKLSKNNLSNLTPHPAMVFIHYSHPTLLQRIKNIRK